MIAVESLKEAFQILRQLPLLWIPGIVTGFFAALLWVLLTTSGTFFAGRLMVILGLILLLLITGMIVLIRNNGGNFSAMISGGLQDYFRVLIPMMVIIFAVIVLFILVLVTFGFMGSAPDPRFIASLTVVVMLPTLILTFFFDTAAVFEDRKVFESIQRSIHIVSENVAQVIAFILLCLLTVFTIFFTLMIVWEAALFEKLEPIMHYGEAEIQAMTPGKLLAMIGPDGIWITAAMLFIAGLLLIPILMTYKCCFFRKIISGVPQVQQMIGEYDSKGRWYKY